MSVRQILFLVGGKGTRLGEITANTPKPLLEIGPDLRFLDILIQEAARHGLTDIILLAGHLGEQVAELFDGKTVGQAKVRVIVEPKPAGTGGALKLVADLLDPWFLVANGDSFFQVNLRAIAQVPTGQELGRLALRQINDPSRFGTVELQGDKIVGFFEKDPTKKGPSLINAGIYLLSPAALQSIEGTCSIEQEVFPLLARQGRLLGIELSGYFLDIGLPDTYETARRELRPQLHRPAVFFDRDGVLNEDAGYTHKPQDLVWIEGAIEAIRAVNDAGWLAIVVTNQAGIARGLFTTAQMEQFHEKMQSDLSQYGAHIDAFYHCPFHKDGLVEAYIHPDHPDRKPNPGMILRAIKDWDINAANSLLVGDRDHDMEAANQADIRGLKYSSGSLASLVNPYLIVPKGNI